MENIDTIFYENLEKLQKASDRVCSLLNNEVHGEVPENLCSPDKQSEVTAVGWVANELYEAGCDISEAAENMMLEKECQSKYEEVRVERYGPRHTSHDTGHKRSDF